MALQLYSNKVLSWICNWYCRAQAKELNKVGLRWEDLIISETPVVQEALQLAHPDVVKGRMRRLKRASDLSFKGKFYTDYKDPASLEPYKMELFPIIQKIKKRNEEEILLNLHKK